MYRLACSHSPELFLFCYSAKGHTARKAYRGTKAMVILMEYVFFIMGVAKDRDDATNGKTVFCIVGCNGSGDSDQNMFMLCIVRKHCRCIFI